MLEKVYIARCPECGSLIKMDKDRLKLFSIEDCYVCEKNITWEDEDIVPVYVLLEKGVPIKRKGVILLWIL